MFPRYRDYYVWCQRQAEKKEAGAAQAIEAAESVNSDPMIEEIAKAIGSARQDAPNEAYGLRMRLSFDEQKRAARAVLAVAKPCA